MTWIMEPLPCREFVRFIVDDEAGLLLLPLLAFGGPFIFAPLRRLIVPVAVFVVLPNSRGYCWMLELEF